MIRIYVTGRHAHRSPLSYPALGQLFVNDFQQVTDPADADLYVFAHISDIQEAPQNMIEDWRRRRRPVLLLSEEPFWDTIWGGQPLDPMLHVDTTFGTLPVHQLNHHTSNIFDFEHLPYYLLTNHRFANAYQYRFARNAARSLSDWQEALSRCPVDISFMFERRPESYHGVHWPQGDIIGLCAWRTELAQACQAPRIERLGHSWSKGQNRLTLTTDWHLDKLMRLDGRARLICAIENTHQPTYITEKFFDAFACGAVPVYFASAGHRLRGMGLPIESWVNLHGKSPQEAVQYIKDWLMHPASDQARSMQAAQATCLEIFKDPAIWQHERIQLRKRLVTVLSRFL